MLAKLMYNMHGIEGTKSYIFLSSLYEDNHSDMQLNSSQICLSSFLVFSFYVTASFLKAGLVIYT